MIEHTQSENIAIKYCAGDPSPLATYPAEGAIDSAWTN
jgi:hypothetical protein